MFGYHPVNNLLFLLLRLIPHIILGIGFLEPLLPGLGEPENAVFGTVSFIRSLKAYHTDPSIVYQNSFYPLIGENMPPAAGVQIAAAVHKSGSAPSFVSSRHIRVALRAVTGEIAANIQDTMSWMLTALGGWNQKRQSAGKVPHHEIGMKSRH
jgi:hypothetical protein